MILDWTGLDFTGLDASFLVPPPTDGLHITWGHTYTHTHTISHQALTAPAFQPSIDLMILISSAQPSSARIHDHLATGLKTSQSPHLLFKSGHRYLTGVSDCRYSSVVKLGHWCWDLDRHSLYLLYLLYSSLIFESSLGSYTKINLSPLSHFFNLTHTMEAFEKYLIIVYQRMIQRRGKKKTYCHHEVFVSAAFDHRRSEEWLIL